MTFNAIFAMPSLKEWFINTGRLINRDCRNAESSHDERATGQRGCHLLERVRWMGEVSCWEDIGILALSNDKFSDLWTSMPLPSYPWPSSSSFSITNRLSFGGGVMVAVLHVLYRPTWFNFKFRPWYHIWRWQIRIDYKIATNMF